MKIKTLNTSQANFDKKLRDHLSFEQGNYESVEKTVNKILKKIRESGDSGLRLLVEKYDKTFYKKISDAIVTKEEISDAYSLTPNKIISSLRKAMRNIKTFSKQQKLESWSIKVKGSKLGEKVTPINSVGIYVPGGKASYPSTVLMNAIPAQVAGVKNITMVCPPVAGKLNPLVLIAADLCGVNKIYKFGGAHAIGALAFGTETIKSVDKIVGPGNIYVAVSYTHLTLPTKA